MTFKMKRELLKTALVVALALAAAILVVMITQLIDHPIRGGYYPHDDERGGSGRHSHIISAISTAPSLSMDFPLIGANLTT